MGPLSINFILIINSIKMIREMISRCKEKNFLITKIICLITPSRNYS